MELALPALGLVPWGYGVYYGFFAYKRPAIKDEEPASSMGDSEKLEQLAVRHGLPTEEEYFSYFFLGGILAEALLALAITFLVLVYYGKVPGAISHWLLCRATGIPAKDLLVHLICWYRSGVTGFVLWIRHLFFFTCAPDHVRVLIQQSSVLLPYVCLYDRLPGCPPSATTTVRWEIHG